MPKDDPQAKQDKIASERSECRGMMLTVKQVDQMTSKHRDDLAKMLRRYDKLLAEKQDEAVREMKAVARKR